MSSSPKNVYQQIVIYNKYASPQLCKVCCSPQFARCNVSRPGARPGTWNNRESNKKLHKNMKTGLRNNQTLGPKTAPSACMHVRACVDISVCCFCWENTQNILESVCDPSARAAVLVAEGAPKLNPSINRLLYPTTHPSDLPVRGHRPTRRKLSGQTDTMVEG